MKRINNLLEEVWDTSKVAPDIFYVPEMSHIGRKYYRFSFKLNQYIRVYKKYGFNIKPTKEQQ